MATQVKAIRAEDFVKSIGVNQHVAYIGTVYANPTLEIQELNYLGINLVRDFAPGWDLAAYQQLANGGVRFDLITGPEGEDLNTTLAGNISSIAALAQSNPGSVLSVEGPNELNSQAVYLSGTSSQNPTTGAAIMEDVSQAVRGNPVLSAQAVKVVNVSVSNGVPNWQSYVTGLGNLDQYVDDSNFHVYYGGAEPLANLHAAYQSAQASAPGKPVIFTETGYTTATTTSAYSGGVDQETQAKNILNALADAYKMGVVQTYIYELMDGVANPASNDAEDQFGLFLSDGTPKLAAVALHNMTSILSDTAADANTFKPGTLNYSIWNLPSTGNSVLMEKANGTFALMVWNEAPDWNSSTESEITARPVIATIKLGATYGTVEVFDPLLGASAIRTFTNVSSLRISLTDHPLIVEVAALPAGTATSLLPATPAPTPIPKLALTPTPTPAPSASSNGAADD